MFARWLFLGTVFLGFTSDYGTAYADSFSPFFWTQYLFWALPWKLRTIDHIMGLCLLLAKGSKTPAVKPMRATLLLSMGTIVVWFLYGIMRGGDPWAGSWQIYLMLSGVLFAFTAAAVIQTPEHCVLLAKTILYAGAYRAFMAICYWALYVLPEKKDPEFLTSHDDSVLFVVCMLLLLLQLFNTSKPAQQAKFLLYLAFFGAAVLNKRRIAWVSLAMGAAVLIAVLPKGRIRRRDQDARRPRPRTSSLHGDRVGTARPSSSLCDLCPRSTPRGYVHKGAQRREPWPDSDLQCQQSADGNGLGTSVHRGLEQVHDRPVLSALAVHSSQQRPWTSRLYGHLPDLRLAGWPFRPRCSWSLAWPTWRLRLSLGK